MGRWLKRGIYPVILLRIFRNGLGRSEERLMDEHIVLSGGDSITLDNDFVDENLNNLSWFCKKHVDYSVREAAEMVDLQYGISERSDEVDLTNQAAIKRKRKLKYAQKPLFWRSFAYFIYRYFLKGAFREGKEGFIFTFIQGWWYRTLVDAKIYEIRKNCGDDKDKIKAYLSKEYNIKI